MSEETERPQWFIAADGTVFESWPPRSDSDRLKYVRYSTTRRLELSELYALDERLEAFKSTSERRSNVPLVLLALIVLVAIAVVLMWLFLPQVGVDTWALVVVTAVLAIMAVFAVPFAGVVMGSRAAFERIYRDAGFETSVPTVLKDREARALIDDPGTVAGRRMGDTER